jgi:Sensors of blue-light using FAD
VTYQTIERQAEGFLLDFGWFAVKNRGYWSYFRGRSETQPAGGPMATQSVTGASEAESLLSIVYVSTAVQQLNAEDLHKLLEAARRSNHRDGITGMLLYFEGSFIQAIEGPSDRVQQLFERLERDPRHYQVIKLVHERIAQRQFPHWSMAFRRATADSLKDAEGFSDFLEPGFDIEALRARPDLAHKLLLTFREVNLDQD